MSPYTTYDDGTLVQLLRSGDQRAFEALYMRWLPFCIDYAFKRTGDREASEDIAQSIFVRLWNRRSALEVDNVGAYLNRAVSNGVASWALHQKRPTALHEPFAAMWAENVSADAQLLEKDLLKLLMLYADTLSEQRRKVFLHAVIDRLSTAEIAEKMQISRKTVQNTLRQAILELQEKLGPVLLVALLAGMIGES